MPCLRTNMPHLRPQRAATANSPRRAGGDGCYRQCTLRRPRILPRSRAFFTSFAVRRIPATSNLVKKVSDVAVGMTPDDALCFSTVHWQELSKQTYILECLITTLADVLLHATNALIRINRL